MSEMESLRQAILAQVTEEGEALLRRARHEHHDLLEKAEVVSSMILPKMSPSNPFSSPMTSAPYWMMTRSKRHV